MGTSSDTAAGAQGVAERLSRALMGPLEAVGSLLAGEIDQLKGRVELHRQGIESAHEQIDELERKLIEKGLI